MNWSPKRKRDVTECVNGSFAWYCVPSILYCVSSLHDSFEGKVVEDRQVDGQYYFSAH